jgi:hypothetical protein
MLNIGYVRFMVFNATFTLNIIYVMLSLFY